MAGWTDVRRSFEALSMGLGGDERSAKWQRILRSATELFTERGFRRTSVEDIALRAQVAKGTVYLHFETKAGLLLHCVVEEKKRYFGRLRPVFAPSLDARERLRTFLRLIVVMANEMPLVARVLSGDPEVVLVLEQQIDPDLREQMVEMQRDFLAELLDGAGSPHRWTREELHDRAIVILGLLHSSNFFVDSHRRGDMSHERFAGLLADMIVDGLAASPPVAVAVTNAAGSKT